MGGMKKGKFGFHRCGSEHEPGRRCLRADLCEVERFSRARISQSQCI